jgi:hypothetical protein
MLLSGLHNSISSILSNIQQDGTFDQGKPIDLLSKNKSMVHSFDLSSATDRLPIDLQAQVIRFLYILLPNISQEGWKDISEA